MDTMMIKQLEAIIEDMAHEVSLLANVSAFFNMVIPNISWVGFYIKYEDTLILGPFQGKVACTHIQIGKGVCGTCAQTLETQRIVNVHEFKGHIACDSASNSEIVIPIIVHDQLYGVLDIDSTAFDRFSKSDQTILEDCVQLIENKLAQISKIKADE